MTKVKEAFTFDQSLSFGYCLPLCVDNIVLNFLKKTWISDYIKVQIYYAEN